MIIRWLGHASFRLEESTGTAIVTDPYNEEVGYKMPRVSANAITVSHQHHDHNCVANVEGDPVVLSTRVGCDVGGVGIMSFVTYHDSEKGKLRGENLVFKYRLDGVDICHLGDIGEPCNPRLLEAIGSVDVLLIPVGGNYTINAEEAKDYVDKIMPSVVIPMHYKEEGCHYDIAEVDEFVDLFDENNVEYIEGDSIELDRTDFDGDFETKLIVFKR